MNDMIYHFIGLGGIGMSALARVLLQQGQTIQGSDAAGSKLLEELQKEGASTWIGHAPDHVEKAGCVVYTSAIKKENMEFRRAKELGLGMLHRSDLLHHLMMGKKPLLVTGVHGKTTTTSLLISVLLQAGLDPSFVVGGIHKETDTNGRHGKGEYFIAEADESDGSFLKTPYFAGIVTNLEDEHLDYWETRDALDAAFQTFFSLGKQFFWCGDDEGLKKLVPKGVSYGFHPGNDLCITSFQSHEKTISYDLSFEGKTYRKIEVALSGRHNGLNSAAVFGLALQLGIEEEAIRRAFRCFQGAVRRLDWKGRCYGIDLFDDYGHHPTEIHVTLKALRDRVKERRIVAVFQPHRYSRVKDLFSSFLTCFEEADLVIMTDIYAAGEDPIEGITTAALYTKMKEKMGTKLHFSPRSQLEQKVVSMLKTHDAVIGLGAGDVTKIGDLILQGIAEKAPKLKVAVAFGGKSVEHPVSLLSARMILSALDPELYDVIQVGLTKEGTWFIAKDTLEQLEQGISFLHHTPKITEDVLSQLSKCDVVIPVFHGPKGEDGMVQGLFEALDLPYASCGYHSSALCMHKGWTKQIALQSGIPTAPFVSLRKGEKTPSLHFDYPVWVKPVHLGSSFGVSRAETVKDLQAAIDLAFSFDDEILIEKEIVGKQIEFGIFGNDCLRVASCEILNHGNFCGYDQKYGKLAYPYAVPPNIPSADLELGIELAQRMYKEAGCKVLARIDFFYDGHFWLNEINPFPGCTPTSAYPEMWHKTGVPMEQICNWFVILAMHKQRRCLV